MKKQRDLDAKKLRARRTTKRKVYFCSYDFSSISPYENDLLACKAIEHVSAAIEIAHIIFKVRFLCFQTKKKIFSWLKEKFFASIPKKWPFGGVINTVIL